MMHGREKSHSAIVAAKPTNKAGRARCGAGGAKGGDQGERGRAKHAPDTETGNACHRRSTAYGKPQG